MKGIIIFIVTIIFFQRVISQSIFDSTYFSDGRLSGYGTFDKEKKQWVQYKFYHNGNISCIERYDSSDFFTSSLKALNINGTTALIFNSKHGLPSGLFEEHYSSGDLKRVGYFYNGFKTGTWKEFHPNGKLSAQYSFLLSKEDSSFNKRLTSDNMDSFATFEETGWGERDSSLGYQYEDVNIVVFKFPYLNSSPWGIWKKYDLKGNLISRKDYTKKKRKQ